MLKGIKIRQLLASQRVWRNSDDKKKNNIFKVVRENKDQPGFLHLVEMSFKKSM